MEKQKKRIKVGTKEFQRKEIENRRQTICRSDVQFSPPCMSCSMRPRQWQKCRSFPFAFIQFDERIMSVLAKGSILTAIVEEALDNCVMVCVGHGLRTFRGVLFDEKSPMISR